MARLLILLIFASLHSISAHQKRGIIETSYHPSQHNIHLPQYYSKDPSTPDQDASKVTPVIVSLHPSSLSSYHINQQYPTVPHAIEYQASAQVPYSVPQNGYPQYIVNQPYQHQPSNLYIPFNQFQQLPAQLNTDFTKTVPTVQSQNGRPIGHKVGSIKSAPLYHHQVYHPLHTSVQHNLGNLKQGPQTFQQQHLPPTPPKVYRNFHPIIPTTHTPVQHPVPVKNSPKEAEEQESNEEINEEEENERLEEEDHEEQRDEEAEDEEHFRPEKFFSGGFHEDDEDRGRYRTREDEEEEHEDRYSESRPSKQSSKYKYPEKKYNYKQSFSPFKSDPDFESFRGFKEPKVEYKMYKYSKSSNKPERKEYIEGKGSENVPVVHHSQKSYKEQWVISSETSSLSNE